MAEFLRGDIVRHMVTRGMYKIVSTPENCFYEPTAEPCYAYQSLSDHRVWVRPQGPMEARFVLEERNGG